MTIHDDLERRVFAEVDTRFDDAISFLRDLVREPSVLGNERGAQEIVFSRLAQMGLEPEMWDLDVEALRRHPLSGRLDVDYHNRPNVTAYWPAASTGGRSLILNGHVDVVPVDPASGWSCDPWQGKVDGDWLYGRGAADMKSGIAAMLLAVESLRAAGAQLRGGVLIQSVIEEECSGNGTLACCLRGMRADGALVCEPAFEAMGASVGLLWFRVAVRGRPGHVAEAKSAVNAIEETYNVIAALQGLEAELNAAPRHQLYATLPHPYNFNVGVIRGGDWPSTVASRCTIECRLGFGPDMTIGAVQERVRETVSAAAEGSAWLRENRPVVEFFGFRAQPWIADPQCALSRLLNECHEHMTNTALQFLPSTGSADQRFFLSEYGMDAAVFGPDGQNLHGTDERVSIESIRHASKVYALFIMRWCGVA